MNRITIISILLLALPFSANAQEKGRLTVSCDQPGATVWVDGERQGLAPMTLELTGEHNIRVENDINHYYRATELVSFTPGMDESRNYVLKAMPHKLYTFVLGQYGFGNSDFGLMLGLCRDWGAFIRAHSNFSSTTESSSFPTISQSLPVKKLSDPYSAGASLGVMRRLHPNLFAFLGVGAFTYRPGLYEDDGSLHHGIDLVPYEINGVCLDLGVIMKYKALLLSAGYSPCIAKTDWVDGARWGDFHVGIGFTIHKNRKR